MIFKEIVIYKFERFSCENLSDLFTKFLPRRTFGKFVHKIGLYHLNDLSIHEGER